jgi:GAF domain-containing protein/HAMP domain-containing protein
MPEEKKPAAPAPAPDSKGGSRPGAPPPAEKSNGKRSASLHWTILIGAGGAASVAVFNLTLFFQTGAWQMLAVAAGSVLAILCLIPAWILDRRRRFDAAGYWTLGGMLLAFGAAELFHAEMTLYLAAGGVLLALIVGNLILPGKRRAWVGAAILFGAYAALVNWWQPLPRFGMRQLGVVSDLFAGGLVTLLIIAALFGIVRAYRQITTIRTRLVASFVAVMLLPVLTIVAALGSFGLQTTQQQVIDRLEPVAALKQAEIEYWVNDLQIDLDITLAGQEVVPNLRTLEQEPAGSQASQAAAEKLREYLAQVLEQTKRYEELFLLDVDGRVVVSTDPTQEGQIRNNQRYFREGLAGPYVQPPYYSVTSMRASLLVARPVLNEQGRTVGVLAGRASLAMLDQLMAEQTGLGTTGETYLIGANHALLTQTRFSRVNVSLYSPGVDDAVDNKRDGSGLYERQGTPVAGAYRWLPQLEVALVAEQDQAEALYGVLTTLEIVAGITLAGIVIAVGVSLLVTRSIAQPLSNLTETTAQVAAGDLSLMADVTRADEIGALAQTFNTLTARLRDLIGGLEDRVTERTRELERRSSYLEASADVGRTAGSVLDPVQLARQVVDLIRKRFDLYYVGLFLLDEAEKWAVLQAGTGQAGQTMLARGHRIRVGEGMIGWSVANNQWRVAQEASEDAVRLATPELPETRSEAAFPLHSRGRVIGALTVQDSRSGAFDQEAIVVLQIMADQVAVALDNARLFMQVQESLEAERRAYGEISRDAWRQMVRSRAIQGYRCNEQGVTTVVAAADAAAGPGLQPSSEGQHVAAIPIQIRDLAVGTLNFRRAGDGTEWTDEEVTLLQSMAEQLGLALDSARLYQDTQRRALREQLTAEIAARIRESLDVETMLRTTVQQVREALHLPEVVVRLAPTAPTRPTDDAKGDGSNDEP